METRQVAVVAVAVVVLAVGGVAATELFAPESATQVDDGIIDASSGGSGGTSDTADGSAGSGGTSDTADGDAPATDTDGSGETVVATGEFEGKAGHDVSGTVELVRADGDLYLRFVDYEQTPGPDVYVYVTPSEDPDTPSEIDAGTKVLIDGGADGGESTKEGTFVQKLPDDVDADDVDGVGVWCDQFSTPFGAASLSR